MSFKTNLVFQLTLLSVLLWVHGVTAAVNASSTVAVYPTATPSPGNATHGGSDPGSLGTGTLGIPFLFVFFRCLVIRFTNPVSEL
jgi:hypothetical protein